MNWYRRAQENKCTPDEIISLARKLIRMAWKSGWLSKENRYSTWHVMQVILNEESIATFLDNLDDDCIESLKKTVEEELIALEEKMYGHRAKKISDDPLKHIRDAIRGKTWEQAKVALTEMLPGGKRFSKDIQISDEEAEQTFARLYGVIYGAGATDIEPLVERSPYVRPDGTRYLRRLSDLRNWGIYGASLEDDPETRQKYNDTYFVTHYWGHNAKAPPPMVEVYRGVPRADAKLRPGDFVTLNRDYARMYMRGKYGAIVRETVPSDDLIIVRDDLPADEEVYLPRDMVGKAEKADVIKPPMTFREFHSHVNA